MSFPLLLLAVASSWSLTTTIDLRDRKTDVSAMLLEIDEERSPIILRLECKDGRSEFQFEWYGHSGPDLMLIEVGEADADRQSFSFRRDPDNRQLYHLANDITAFMARFVTYQKPTFLAHFADGSRLWTFETGETSEAWSRVSAAWHR